jgi:hypothetical protein
MLLVDKNLDDTPGEICVHSILLRDEVSSNILKVLLTLDFWQLGDNEGWEFDCREQETKLVVPRKQGLCLQYYLETEDSILDKLHPDSESIWVDYFKTWVSNGTRIVEC